MIETNPLYSLFHARSIAVIGASRNTGQIGHRVLKNLIQNKFPGKLFPINPKADSILGLKSYPSLEKLNEPIDLVVVCIPAALVPEIARQAAKKKATSMVVISSGFSEIGLAGKALQEELLQITKSAGIRLLGPNCFGFLSTDPKWPVNASFTDRFPIAGNIAMASQSGGMGLAVLALAQHRNIGLSSFVSMGNKADISSNDLLGYWDQDPNTKVILLYLESFGNPARFCKIAREITHRKPILSIKSGRSQSGQRAAQSHTAALATSDRAVEGLFRQAGVVRVQSLEEMFSLAIALSAQKPPLGIRVGIITNGGGPAVLCTDFLETYGLSVPEFSTKLQNLLKSFLSPASSPRNPVDLVATTSAGDYEKTISALIASGEIDALIVLHSVIDTEIPEDLIHAIGKGVTEGRIRNPIDLPVLAAIIQASDILPSIKTDNEWVPVYRFPEDCARVLSQMWTYARYKSRSLPNYIKVDFPNLPLHRTLFQKYQKQSSPWLSAKDTYRFLEESGINLVNSQFTNSKEEALQFAKTVGYPLAAKIYSPKILHKTEKGGVRLNIYSKDALLTAIQELETLIHSLDDKSEAGILLQPMVQDGVELIIGMQRDPVFGPLIAFGFGGIFVEVLSDTQIRVAPVSQADALEMIRDTKGFKLLDGYRGKDKVDLNALSQLLLRISSLSEQVPELQSLDLNPIMASKTGYVCVDARVRVTQNETT